MNLINKKVTHKRFGIGSIVKHNDSSIEIHFGSENKRFVFPDVFGKHLKIHDKSDAKLLEEIIQKRKLSEKRKNGRRKRKKYYKEKNWYFVWNTKNLCITINFILHHKWFFGVTQKNRIVLFQSGKFFRAY